MGEVTRIIAKRLGRKGEGTEGIGTWAKSKNSRGAVLPVDDIHQQRRINANNFDNIQPNNGHKHEQKRGVSSHKVKQGLAALRF